MEQDEKGFMIVIVVIVIVMVAVFGYMIFKSLPVPNVTNITSTVSGLR